MPLKRKIYGYIYKPDGSPWEGVTVPFKLVDSGYSPEGLFPIDKLEPVTDADGRFEADLWCSDNAFEKVEWRCTPPDQNNHPQTFKFIWLYGDGTPVNIAAVRAAGQTVPAEKQPTYNALIESQLLAHTTEYDHTLLATLDPEGDGTQFWSNDGTFKSVAGSVDSVNGETGVVVLDKTDIGLSNVDNTSDADKPISTATQTALDAKADTPGADELYVSSAEKTAWNAKDTDAIAAIRNGVATEGDDLAKIYALIEAINAIIGSGEADADNLVDTVSELLEVFENYSEGVDIATLFNSKVDTSAIINTLTETASGKTLDARQGKVLKDLIDALTTADIPDSTDMRYVTDAEQTKLGNVPSDTNSELAEKGKHTVLADNTLPATATKGESVTLLNGKRYNADDTDSWVEVVEAPEQGSAANEIIGRNAANTANEYKEIVAGSGIQINHTAGQIEVVNSGGGGAAASGTFLIDDGSSTIDGLFTFDDGDSA